MPVSDPLLSSRNQRWVTPPDVFAALHREFGFVLDAAAEKRSRRVPWYFGPDHDDPAMRDALSDVSWYDRLPAAIRDAAPAPAWLYAWLNPPYGRALPKWTERAYLESRARMNVVGLIHARTETAWWRDHVERSAEVRLLPRRIVFLDPDTLKPAVDKKGRPQGSTAPHAVVIWRPGYEGPPHYRRWDWKEAA